jgi:hypothetical protein
MGKDTFICVLTADVVSSIELESNWRLRLQKVLDKLKKHWKEKIPVPFEIVRGDQIQGVLDAEYAARIFVSLLLELKQLEIEIRVSLGVGKLGKISKHSLGWSDGEAFRLSGRALDSLGDKRRIICVTEQEQLNKTFEVMTKNLEFIFSKMTIIEAGTILLAIDKLTQNEISKKLGKAQPTVAKSLGSGGFGAINSFIEWWEGQWTTFV